MATRARAPRCESLTFAVATPPPRGRTSEAVRSTPETRTSAHAIPSVDALLRSIPGRKAGAKFGRAVLKRSVQEALAEVRREVVRGGAVPEDAAMLARAVGMAARDFYGLSDVLNATGVILHTGLGRAPLPDRAAQAAADAARGYVDLEVERETGARGRRTARAERLLCALTGAEAALVVNNGAAALLLSLAALAQRREVVVSRGELIEIGGEFRLPDILTASGAKLLEVGTTNRTRASDYRRALSPKTGAILKVHPSNYRVVGFAASASVAELAPVARAAGVPLLDDVGSGLLDRFGDIPSEEPTVVDALAAGADVVTFSGDKLLGGPQAGVLVGRAPLLERMRRHPLARALRVDKMTVAAIEAILRLYATDRRSEIPLWEMLGRSPAQLERRARSLASCLDGARVRAESSVVGGGSLPGYAVPSAALVIETEPRRAPEMSARLRLGRPPVFCRVDGDALVFDLRTVAPEDDDRLLRAIRYALEQG